MSSMTYEDANERFRRGKVLSIHDGEPFGFGEEPEAGAVGEPGEGDAPNPFPVKSYSGLPKKPDWLFDGLLEAGTCMIVAAEPKAGKSWFTFDAGICLATGQKFLGEWAPTRTGVTLYYSPEGGDRGRHARINGLCWGRNLEHDRVHQSLKFLDCRLDMTLEEHAERLGATIDAVNARMVVIDPLISASIGIDENSAGDVMRVLNPLRDLITARPQCALVLVHHTGKQAKSSSMAMAIRGSSAINGWWDSMVTIRRGDDDSNGPRRVDVFHRDAMAPEPMGFELHHDEDRDHLGHSWFRLTPCDSPELNARGGLKKDAGAKLNDGLLEQITEFVKAHPLQFTRGAGAKEMGIDDRNKFNRHFDELVRRGIAQLGVANLMTVA